MIIEVWQRVMDLSKSGTTGVDNQDEFNRKANAAQKMLQESLIDVAEVNSKASDALSWLKQRSGELTTLAGGEIPAIADYLHFDSIELVNNAGIWPGTKLATNEIASTRISPIRKPDLALNEICCYMEDGKRFVMPEQAGIKVRVRFYKPVPDAAIVLTPAEDDERDYVTPSVGTDFGWPSSMFNILVYAILEQFSVELKDTMLFEYSQYGINRETIKTTAQ